MATIGVYELLVTVKYISELEHSAPGLFGRLTALPSKLQLLLIKMDIAHRKMWPEAGRRPAAAYMICLTRELPGDVRIRRKGGPLGEWGQRLVGGRAPNGNSRWGTCKNIDLFEQVWAALPDAEKAQFEIPELLSFVSAIERDCVDNHVERQNQLFISIKYWLQLKVRTAEKFGTLHQILSDNLFCVTLGLGPYGGAGHDDLIRLFVPPIQALVDEHLAGHRPDVERLEQVVHRIWWLLVYHYDLAQSVHIAPLVTLSQWYPSTHLIPLSSMLAAIDRLTNKKRDPEVVVLYETFLTTVAKPAIESIAQGEAEGTVYGELQTVIEMDAKYGISDDETFAAVIAVAKKAIFDLQDDNYMPNSRWPRVRECIARLAPAIAMRDPALLLDWCDEKLLALFDGLQPNSVLRGKIAQAMMACHASLGEEQSSHIQECIARYAPADFMTLTPGSEALEPSSLERNFMRLVDTMTDINLQFNVNVLGFQVDFLLTHRNGRQLLLETDGVAYHKRFGGSQDLPHDAYKNAIFNTAYKQSPLVRISSDELADPEKIKQKIYAKLDDAVTENCSDW